MPERVSVAKDSVTQPLGKGRVTVRPFPWPHRGMLAICSDIDATTPQTFVQLHRFLNTREATELGQGLGLDVADSFWFYAQNSAQMAFFSGMNWQKRAPHAEWILDFIRGGWIDTLHSYGNFSSAPAEHPDRFTREHAKRALAVLGDAGLTIKVWSNHGNANNIQNIGRRDLGWCGDDPSQPCYHNDLTMDSGIYSIWSAVQGYEFRRDVAVRLRELRDGRKVWEFPRHDVARCDLRTGADLARRFGARTRLRRRDAISVLWHPRLLHVQLSRENLADLVENGGYAIVGQHLGYRFDVTNGLSEEAVDALRRLKAAQDAGDILVARTSRLLEYAVTRDRLRFEAVVDSAGKTVIDIRGIDDPVRGERPLEIERLRGICFEVTGDGPVELRLRGAPIVRREIAEHRLPEKQVVGIRWYPPDYTDCAYEWKRREVSL